MPQLFNGIGTWYLGRKNVQTRQGLCEQCGAPGTLSSYDTRLWFLLIYIPLIPLGKKRVLDECAKCRRHRVLSLNEWEKAKQEGITEALTRMNANPLDPKPAVELHARLLAFGQVAEAEKVRVKVRERFAGNAGAHADLAGSLQFHGHHEPALECFQQALRLDPELPAAKVAVAVDLIERGQIDEGRKLLKFLEAPDRKDGLAQLWFLASAYQKANRHTDASELFHLLLGRFPDLSNDKEFRKAVKATERALGKKASALPRFAFDFKPFLGFGAVAAAILAAVIGSQYYIYTHRTLNLVSGLAETATVEIPGHGSVKVKAGRSSATMTLPEGSYRAVISGPIKQEVRFTIQSSFFDRWFSKPAYVFNVGGSALLIHETTVYSRNSSVDGSTHQFSLHFGQPFLFLANVDYCFEPFPPKISTKSSRLEKTRIGMLDAPPLNAIYALIERKHQDQALQLAEWRLRSNPGDQDVLQIYAGLGMSLKQDARVRAFLGEGTRRRPIEIPWHRFYQEFRKGADDQPALIAEYEDMLKAEPGNSALIYLRGRLASGNRESSSYFERAIARDPGNAYAQFALAYDLAGAGDWAGARSHAALACSADPSNKQFDSVLFEARMALGELKPLEAELRQALTGQPLDMILNERLCQVLAAQDKKAEVESVLSAYHILVKSRAPKQADQAIASLRADALYFTGGFADLEKTARADRSGNLQRYLYMALVEQGRLKEAGEVYAMDDPRVADPFHYLAFSIACKAAGDEAMAAASRQRAVDRMKAGRIEYASAANLLQRPEPPSLEELRDITMPPAQKASLAVALAQRFPVRSGELLAFASNQSVERIFPYHLLHRVIGDSSRAGK